MRQEWKLKNLVSMRNAFRILLAAILLLILFLAIVYGSPTSVGVRDLTRFCEKDAGFHVYQTVRANGYYNATGSADIIHSPYEFIEYCDDTSSSHRAIVGPGCFRLTKVNRSTAKCHARLDAKLSKFTVEPYPEFLATKCIAVEKLSRPTARYSYHADIKKWRARKRGDSRFWRVEILIRDDLEDQILARYVNYSFFHKPKLASPIRCHHVNEKHPTYAGLNMIESVIRIP
jgi:hypothetical protein